jgi:hypothetical protein
MKDWILALFIFLLFFSLNPLFSQPVMDGSFDGEAIWGTPVAIADGSAGWASANAKKLYVVENGPYIYFGADITASDWMVWAFLVNTKSGGGSTESWSRSIDYNHSEAPDYVLRGSFGAYAEYHSWNGSGWSGVGTSISSSEFGENIDGTDQNGWVECRVLKSSLGSVSTGDVQFYITGNNNDHGTFDAVPDDENSTSWDHSGNHTVLDHYTLDVDFGSPVVEVSPAFPDANEAITVSFHASGTALEGASKVYFHSGVSVSESSVYNFDYAIGNWGADDGVGEMTSLGNDNWQFVISDINTYYGVSPEDDVFGLNFLFRSPDGTLKEDNSGANFHEDVDPGDYFTISSPEFDPFLVEANIAFDVEASANNEPDTWTLFEIDLVTGAVLNTVFTQSGGLGFTHSMSQSSTGLKKYKLEVDFGTAVRYKSFKVKTHNPVTIVSRPAWTNLGINYHSDDPTKATLVLHAPVYTVYKDGNGTQSGTNTTQPKEVVYVVGDFNNWTLSEAYKMNRDRDGWDGSADSDNDDDHGDYWWIELNGLTPGQEYIFQYWMNGGVQVADPYCTKVSDPDDHYIPDAVYPDLIEYPGGINGRASVLQTDQEAYTWTAPSFNRPTPNHLNIYEMHFRDFTEEGTYLAAIDKLDYIKGLGINAIHVMPVSEFEGNSSWGYNPNFYFAADKAYGKAEDLKLFVDECHKREIQVLNDLVLNHAFYSNVMAKMYWNSADNKPANDNPWFNPDHKMVYDQAGWWGADWNHESVHTQNMVDSILKYWMTEFNFDGFRFDFTKGFGQTAPDPGDQWASSYDQDRIDLLKRMVDQMWINKPGSIAVFEHLANSDENQVLGNYGILQWSGVGHHERLKDFVLGYDDNNVDPNIYESGIYNSPSIGFTYANWISYPESHDEERLGYELSQNFNGPKTTETLIDRMKLGLAFNLFFPGPRMLWQFEELGYDISIGFNGRTGEKPVKWEYFEDATRRELYTLVQKIFKVRNNYDLYNTAPDYGNIGLGHGNITTPRKMSFDDGNGHHVIVVGNLDPNASHVVTPGYDVIGTWYKYNGENGTDGTSFTVNSTGDSYTLAPSEVFILTNFEIDKCLEVVNTNNDGYGSLREAVGCATNGETIFFDYLVWGDSITLTTPISLDKDLFFLENGSDITIDGSSSSKAFQISADGEITLKGLNIICGSDTDGRCIENEGNLILENVIFLEEVEGSGSTISNASNATLEIRGEVEIK